MDVVDQPPGCSDNDFYSLFQLLELCVIGLPAIDGDDPEPTVSPQ